MTAQKASYSPLPRPHPTPGVTAHKTADINGDGFLPNAGRRMVNQKLDKPLSNLSTGNSKAALLFWRFLIVLFTFC